MLLAHQNLVCKTCLGQWHKSTIWQLNTSFTELSFSSN
jgi:hypothetical protein